MIMGNFLRNRKSIRDFKANQVEFGVLESECSSLLSEFFKSIRNKK